MCCVLFVSFCPWCCGMSSTGHRMSCFDRRDPAGQLPYSEDGVPAAPQLLKGQQVLHAYRWESSAHGEASVLPMRSLKVVQIPGNLPKAEPVLLEEECSLVGAFPRDRATYFELLRSSWLVVVPLKQPGCFQALQP